MTKKGRLTVKQAVFVQEYLTDLNATQAAIRAGYSKKTANRIATENLSKPVIAAAISKAQLKRQQRTEITQDKVLKDIARISQKAEDAEQYASALKGHEMLAKHVKLFSDSVDVSIKTPPVLKVIFENANADSSTT